MRAAPKEIRAARAFLQTKGARTHDISPKKFADAAKELDIGFTELLKFIARLYGGGQNQSQFRMDVIAQQSAAEAAIAAKGVKS